MGMKTPYVEKKVSTPGEIERVISPEPSPRVSLQEIDTTSTHSKHTLSGTALVVVIFSLCLAQFLAALDITIVATALPTIARQLGATSTQYTWVGTSYNLASTASTPIWAKCSDIWGRKPLMLLANACFMLGSLIAGLCTSPGMLISGRTVQGFGGGGIVIMVTIVIADLFPLRERAKYYGFSAIVWAVASALGPVLGGVFTQTIGWKWCFLINVPLDAVSLLLLWVVLRIQTPKVGLIEGLKGFDWVGCATIVSGTICFLCGLEGGASSQHAWVSAYTLCLLLIGAALLAVFIYWELRFASLPIMPLRVFKGRVSAAALVAATCHGFVFIAYDYYLPLYFQVILGATPIMSGVQLFALVIPLSFFSAATGLYIQKTGHYHYAAWFGSIIMTIGTGLFIDLDRRYILWKIIVYQCIAGIGAGPLFLSPMLALQNHLRKQDIATGTSAFTFMRSIAASISIVVGGVVLQANLGGANLTDVVVSHENQNATGSVLVQQYVHALKIMWAFYAAVGGLILVSSLMITTNQPKQPNPSSESDSASK